MTQFEEPEVIVPREPKPAAWKGLIFFIFIVALGAVASLFVMRQRSPEGPLIVHSEPMPLAVNVQSVRLQESFSSDERFSGMVTPQRTSRLGFSGSGRIDRLYVDIGTRVKTGQVLAALDTRSLQAQLATAQAHVDEATAAYELALTTVDRQVALSVKGHVSQQRVDEATAQAHTAAARIAAAEASADTLRVQIDLARITAPFDGVITERLADEGVIAGPAQPIFELVETGNLEARIGLTARLAASLEIGQTYTLVSEQGEVAARLRSVTGVIDAGQRTVTTVFDIQEPDRVAIGAVVRIQLDRQVDQAGAWVPVSALTEKEHGLWAVYVARREGSGWRARPGTVEVIHTDGERAYVRGALRDGDLVILDGLQRITPGQPVIPTESGQTASKTGNG